MRKDKGGMTYLMQLAGKNKRLLYIAGGFSILSGLCAFIPFVMVYQTLVALFNDTLNTQTIMNYGFIAAGAIILKFLFMILGLGSSHIGAFNVLYTVRIELMKHISKINLGFYTKNTSGEVKKVVIEDVERIENFLAHQIPDLVTAIVVPVLIFIYMCTMNIIMAFAMLLPVILGSIIQGITMKRVGPQMPIYHRLLAKMNSAIMQFINGMPEMKSFNMTTKSFKEYATAVKDYDTFWHSCTKAMGYPYTIFAVMTQSGIFFTLPIGGYLFLQGELSLSAYLFFMIMSLVFLTMLTNLVNFAQTYSQISTGVNHIKEIMSIPETKTNDLLFSDNEDYSIVFKEVSFGYEEKEVIADVSIEIPQGTLTAFVGASGAGKSTAAQLIPKFWEVTKGSISIGNLNINDIKEEDLMNHVSFVFQETFMLNDTIYENIAIGKKDCSVEQVETAAKAAQIHDFINKLPKGYQTLLGESGIKMSGGEKQRICIARAILKDSPIIIFDEATSYTDIENEHKIQLALNHLLVGKTTVMIAHRLHTIKNADQICVFDKGTVVESGTHSQLIDKNGTYAHMWDTYIGTNNGGHENV